MKITWKFWLWRSQIRDARERLLAIRALSEIFYNDTRLSQITKLTEY